MLVVNVNVDQCEPKENHAAASRRCGQARQAGATGAAAECHGRPLIYSGVSGGTLCWQTSKPLCTKMHRRIGGTNQNGNGSRVPREIHPLRNTASVFVLILVYILRMLIMIDDVNDEFIYS